VGELVFAHRALELSREREAPMSSPTTLLAERFERALVAAFGPDFAGTDAALRRSDHADYQANVALGLKKRVPGAPRDTAAKLLAAAQLDDLCEKVEIAGPGFINLTLRPEILADLAHEAARDPRLGVACTDAPDTVVIDYSAPNIAKEMHVGHLRSTILGDAVARTMEFLGHRVVRQNHLGDWGTPFGMLIEHLIDLGEDATDLTVGDLNGFYKAARAKFEASPEFAERARKRVVELQAGDARTIALWKRLVDESTRYFQAVYDKLGVTLRPEHAAGESLYNDRLAGVAEELERRELARVDDGALCAFPPGFSGKGGAPVPLIVRKQDGGYGYATTDLAAVKYRVDALGGTRLVYVVGAPQAQHLAMVYKTAELAGWLAPPVRAEHMAFGSVLGADGKMFKSRSGDTVKLMELLVEAEERALAAVREKNADLDEAAQRAIAHAVGIGAIKYADLSSDRVKDYVFEWSRMLAFEGNTGPYLMYQHARIRSIFRRAGLTPNPNERIVVEAKEERALVLALLAFEGVVRDVAAHLEPHRMCTYLYELASTFSSFYERCPVLKSEGATRASRLALCDLTARVLAQGLSLLGIEAPEQM
jgi:arginyl-tRNA synthetase